MLAPLASLSRSGTRLVREPRAQRFAMAAMLSVLSLGAAACDATNTGKPPEAPPTASPGAPAKPPPPAAATEPEPAAPLEREVWRWAKDIAAAYEPSAGYEGRTLGSGESVDMPVVLQEGRCVRILAVAEAGVEDLALSLFDANGSLARDEAAEGPRASIGDAHPLCVARTAVHRLKVAARKGQGAFALRVYQSPY